MERNLLRELKSDLEFMSDVERRIANAILSDPKTFISHSLTNLSKDTGVSQGSVINFANKYVGGGFTSLKLEIASCLSEREQPFSVVKASDSLKDIFRKTSHDAYDALKNTASVNTDETLHRVAERILQAKKVEIYGVFRSAAVATDFYYQLLQLGVPATFVSDVLTCAVSASMLGEGSLVVAISASGQTQDVIDAVRLAKANGVPIVSITAHKSSPLSKLSDDVLISAPSGNSLSTSATEIRLSQLVITDALCSYLQSRLDADGQKGYFKMNEILKSHNVRD